MLERSAHTAYMPQSPCLVAAGASSTLSKEFFMAMMSFNAPAEREKSLWLVRKESNPNHSQWYIDRLGDGG